MRWWVVLAGWITKDLASPTLAKWEKMFRDSIRALPAARSPWMVKLNTAPAPLGSSRLASSWSG